MQGEKEESIQKKKRQEQINENGKITIPDVNKCLKEIQLKFSLHKR